MKTIADIIHTNNFPLEILDSNGNTIYFEYGDGFWGINKYDEYENRIYSENSEIGDFTTLTLRYKNG